MAQIRPMEEHEAERVRDLWLQMCAEEGTPLPAASSQLILANLRQYATHQSVHCFVAEEQQAIIGFVTCCVSGIGGEGGGVAVFFPDKNMLL